MSPALGGAAIDSGGLFRFHQNRFNFVVSSTSIGPQSDLIDPLAAIRQPFLRRLYALVERPIGNWLGFPQINAIHRSILETPPEDFFAEALACLGIRYEVNADGLEDIPAKGPLVVVANHPFGGIDGLILGHLLQRVRPDNKLLVNLMLHRIEGMRWHSIAVDPFGGRDATRRNAAGVREALRHLRNGGCLGTFPAGEVSHLHLRQRRVIDSPWNPITARIIRQTGAMVVPLYFNGRNGPLFQLAGLIHPLLRTLLLPRELVRSRNSEIRVAVGSPIAPKRLQSLADDARMIEFLRLRTYLLGKREPERTENPICIEPQSAAAGSGGSGKRLQPLADPIDPAALEAELTALPDSACLVRKKEFEVWCAYGREIPKIVLELGRLREATFRDAKEGTGEARDNDPFDDDYLQLFIWNREARHIVGAYRLGQTDEILPRKRKRGFYTHTLFRYRTAFLQRLNPALELGRSFICTAYQRKYASLALLWQGIGAYIAQNPRYRMLFGPVSINQDYTTVSKDLIIHFLKGKNFDQKLSAKVRAKTPPRRRSSLSKAERETIATSVHDIDEISALISEVEHDRKGIPTLLRHYVKLNARFLCFNIDPQFSDVLDGLMIVDLLKTDPKIVRFFLGSRAADDFYRHHQFLGVHPLQPEEEVPASREGAASS